MNAAVVRGWCPGAWRPMASGDGLLVRVRPPLGRLTRAQALALAHAAIAHGNGQIDLTSRANLQLRGVREAAWPALIERLVAIGLVDPDPARDGRRNLLVAPRWRERDDTWHIAVALAARVDELPDLPGKVGFAIDAGPAPVLRDASADFRVERDGDGGLLLRADGRETGCAVTLGGAADALIALARWFAASGGARAGRMARHGAALPSWALGERRPAVSTPPPLPGQDPRGTAYGVAFGRIEAAALIALIKTEQPTALRLTPWRIVIAEPNRPPPAFAEEGGYPSRGDGEDDEGLCSDGRKKALLHAAPAKTGEGFASGFLTDPSSPLLHADACPGAPACPQGTVETRSLALRLAPLVRGRLHVSGCAKGCARLQAADVVLTGRGGRFDLAFAARAGDPPAQASLTPAQVLARFGAA